MQDLFRHLRIHAGVADMKRKILKVAKKLEKASKAHAAQAVTLEKIAKKSTGGMADYYKDIL